MDPHPVKSLIDKADSTIYQLDCDSLVDIYTDDTVLVMQPGMNAMGKEHIRKAFEAIASHFNHTLKVKQAEIEIPETGDTALVLAKTCISAKNQPEIERKATYVFKKDLNNNRGCAIGNLYGHDILD